MNTACKLRFLSIPEEFWLSYLSVTRGVYIQQKTSRELMDDLNVALALTIHITQSRHVEQEACYQPIFVTLLQTSSKLVRGEMNWLCSIYPCYMIRKWLLERCREVLTIDDTDRKAKYRRNYIIGIQEFQIWCGQICSLQRHSELEKNTNSEMCSTLC